MKYEEEFLDKYNEARYNAGMFAVNYVMPFLALLGYLLFKYYGN